MKQDHIKVRKARDADIDVLIDLSEQLGYPTTREDFQKRFSALSQEDDQVILVAEIREHEVVGWVHVLPRVLLIMVVRSNIVREGAHDFYPNVGYTHIKTSRVYIKQI